MYARSINFLTQLQPKKNRTASVLVSAPTKLGPDFEFTKLKAKQKEGFLLLFVKLTDN